MNFSGTYLDLWEKLDSITELDPQMSIGELDKVMPMISSPYERANMFLWGYPVVYDELGQYDLLLDKLLEAQQEGHYFMLRRGERAWPRWVPEVEKLDGFEAFFTENDRRKAVAKEKAFNEFFVQLPEQYDPDRQYPLLVVLHGGVGSHYQSSQYWKSDNLNEDFITAFLQGGIVQGEFQRSFNRGESIDNILAMYNEVISKYPVDTARIFIGGPSAGGMRSIIMGYDERFNIAGLLLTFPVVPRNIDEEKLDIMSNKNLRVVLMTGETDFGLGRQKKFMVSLDTIEMPNRFLIFPEKGHQYPENFGHHLDTSIDFLLKAEEETEIE